MELFKSFGGKCNTVMFHLKQDGYNFEITLDFGWKSRSQKHIGKYFIKKHVPVSVLFCDFPQFKPKTFYLEYDDDDRKTLAFDFDKDIKKKIEYWIKDLKKTHPLDFGIVSDKVAEEYNGRCFAKMDKSCSIRAIRFEKQEDGLCVIIFEFSLTSGKVTDLVKEKCVCDYNSNQRDSKKCFNYIKEIEKSNGYNEVDESIFNAVGDIVKISCKNTNYATDMGQVSNLLHFLFYRMPIGE